MNICAQNLLVCNSGQHTCVTGLFNFFFVLQDLIDRINSYLQRIALFRELASYCLLHPSLDGMVLHKVERKNYGRKSGGEYKISKSTFF